PLKFWVEEGKRSRPQPNPAVLAIINANTTGESTISEDEITDRLFLPVLLEATRLLEDGIVREPADVDMGLILGIGFPPFRGGILRWCDTEGPANVLDRLAKYSALGKRFEPTSSLKKLAQGGGRFYPLPKMATTFGG